MPEKELLVTLRVKHDIERAGGRTFKLRVKAGLRIGRQPIEENAKGIAGIELGYRGIPLRPDRRIRLNRKTRGAELAKEFASSIVREPEIAVDKFLIEDRSAEKTPHLLFFDRIARGRQDVTAPGEDRARNLPIERKEKGERAFIKRENRIAAPQLDVIGRCDAINIGDIDAQRLDRIVQFMR